VSTQTEVNRNGGEVQEGAGEEVGLLPVDPLLSPESGWKPVQRLQVGGRARELYRAAAEVAAVVRNE